MSRFCLFFLLCTFLSSTVLSFSAFLPASSRSSSSINTSPMAIKGGFISTSRTFATATPSGSSSSNGARSMSMNTAERTYIMVKPDGVQRGIVSNIIERFENRGFQLVGMKLNKPSQATLEEHYKDLAEKPFFPKLMTYMTSGPVVCMVWQGKDVVATGRKMLGATNPLESLPGTIRGDYAIEVGRNICHGSDSVESAEREIALWFKDGEVIDWSSHSHDWIYE